VGDVVQVYGRTILLTDCDDFTKEYYRQIAMEQPDPIEEEVDAFSHTQSALKVNKAVQPRTYEKLYREVMLGGGHVNADMQQFMENDRRVLRFFAIHDDLSTPQYERRPFTILFFLADDQVEIREQYPLNCGRDNFPIFYRKNKLPVGAISVAGPQSQPKKKHEFVHGADFYVGQMLTLNGTKFMIYDADDFTRQYFKEALGQELAPKMDVSLPDRAVPRASTPPYKGFGSWGDSMASVMHLIPKAPRKDFNKLYHHDGKILRFTARFVNPKPEDVDRIFVVNFYLADDCVSIHEPPQRNLGIVTGKFLEKGNHVNQETGKGFEPADLLPGKIIKCYNHDFEILDCDEYTRTMLENPDARRQFDLVAVMEKIRESMRQQFPLVRDIFRRFDTDHDGVLTLPEFRRALEKFSFQLSDEEVLAVMKHFDSRGDGQVSYNEFCDALLEEDYTEEMMKTKPPINPDFRRDYAEKAATKTFERTETESVRKAVREVGEVLYKKVGMVNRLIKEFQHLTHKPVISCAQLQHAFLQLGHTFDLQDLERVVLFALPGANLDAIVYVRLLQALNDCYHEVCHCR